MGRAQPRAAAPAPAHDKPRLFLGSEYNRGQKSAGLVISDPRDNISSNLSELGLFDFWISPPTKYHISPLPNSGMIPVCCTRHPSPTTKNHEHNYDSIPRLLCARQSFALTQTRQQQHHHQHRNRHRHTTPAPWCLQKMILGVVAETQSKPPHLGVGAATPLWLVVDM